MTLRSRDFRLKTDVRVIRACDPSKGLAWRVGYDSYIVMFLVYRYKLKINDHSNGNEKVDFSTLIGQIWIGFLPYQVERSPRLIHMGNVAIATTVVSNFRFFFEILHFPTGRFANFQHLRVYLSIFQFFSGSTFSVLLVCWSTIVVLFFGPCLLIHYSGPLFRSMSVSLSVCVSVLNLISETARWIFMKLGRHDQYGPRMFHFLGRCHSNGRCYGRFKKHAFLALFELKKLIPPTVFIRSSSFLHRIILRRISKTSRAIFLNFDFVA